MITVGAIIDTYLNRPTLKPSTRVQYDRAARRSFGDWWERPVAEITAEELAERFGSIDRDGTASSLLSFTVLSGACLQSPTLFDTPPPIVTFVKATRAVYRKRFTVRGRRAAG